MITVLKAAYYAFCALLIGLSTTLLISLSVWLEMRVHNRYIIAGAIACGIIYSFFKKEIQIFPFIASEILLFLLIFWLDKPNLIYYLIKESYLEFTTFDEIRYAFLAVLSLANLLILCKWLKNR